MGLRMNFMLVQLRLKAMARDFKWTLDRYGEMSLEMGEDRAKIGCQGYPHKSDTPVLHPLPPKKALTTQRRGEVSHKHLSEFNKRVIAHSLKYNWTQEHIPLTILHSKQNGTTFLTQRFPKESHDQMPNRNVRFCSLKEMYHFIFYQRETYNASL